MNKQETPRKENSSNSFINHLGITYKNQQLYIRLPENKVLSVHENYIKKILDIPFAAINAK